MLTEKAVRGGMGIADTAMDMGMAMEASVSAMDTGMAMAMDMAMEVLEES